MCFLFCCNFSPSSTSFAGILVNLHHPPELVSPFSQLSTENEVDSDESSCGAINARVLQQAVAAKWAVDVINNRSLDGELKIGENQAAFV